MSKRRLNVLCLVVRLHGILDLPNDLGDLLILLHRLLMALKGCLEHLYGLALTLSELLQAGCILLLLLHQLLVHSRTLLRLLGQLLKNLLALTNLLRNLRIVVHLIHSVYSS
ncbi:hypothetical protein [Paenibacillus sp. MDMC362]|uniref:hypothetical protein n=1 Tax=Paenibacillus sp. MDMC362 TaxID=2977365 RepID=UPI0015EB4616|nr:hypothetical protein [Paenibacillus sp. MDMC362]